jgi:hypothetical protein
MQKMQPCARCEQELPEAFFDSFTAPFCKRCTHDVTDILRRKYNVIESAHFRARLRHSSRLLKRRIAISVFATAGD